MFPGYPMIATHKLNKTGTHSRTCQAMSIGIASGTCGPGRARCDRDACELPIAVTQAPGSGFPLRFCI